MSKPLNPKLAFISPVKAVINHVESSIDFTLFQPQALLSTHIQGLWVASTSLNQQQSLTRWLYGDAGSGIIFNLTRNIELAGVTHSPGVILQPVSTQAQPISLAPGSQRVGVRFHPAAALGVLTVFAEQSLALEPQGQHLPALNALFNDLSKVSGHYAQIVILYRWLHQLLGVAQSPPYSLTQALDDLQRRQSTGHLTGDIAKISGNIGLSQRQLERQCQKWLGITAKHYQRIMRVNDTRNSLKHNPDIDLATLALEKGFTDQAHMTREFKNIAQITPKKFTLLLKA